MTAMRYETTPILVMKWNKYYLEKVLERRKKEREREKYEQERKKKKKKKN